MAGRLLDSQASELSLTGAVDLSGVAQAGPGDGDAFPGTLGQDRRGGGSRGEGQHRCAVEAAGEEEDGEGEEGDEITGHGISFARLVDTLSSPREIMGITSQHFAELERRAI